MKFELWKLLLAGTAAMMLPLSATASASMGEATDGRCLSFSFRQEISLPHRLPYPEMSDFTAQGVRHVPPILRDLILTEDQQDKIFELLHAQVPVLRAKAKAAAKAQLVLRHLVHTESFDAARMRILVDAHGNALADMALMRAQIESRIRALLTPEQRMLLDKRFVKMESRLALGGKPS